MQNKINLEEHITYDNTVQPRQSLLLAMNGLRLGRVHNKLKISAMKKNMNFFGGLVVTYNNRKMSMKEKK